MLTTVGATASVLASVGDRRDSSTGRLTVQEPRLKIVIDYFGGMGCGLVERSVTSRRKQTLIEDLRAASRDGRLVPGDALPPVRDLAQRYQLAARTVSQALQHLVDDGVLTSIPRVGIFVARSVVSSSAVYITLVPRENLSRTDNALLQQMYGGFEARLAQLGARSMRLPVDALAERIHSDWFSAIAGVFIPSPASLSAPLARAIESHDHVFYAPSRIPQRTEGNPPGGRSRYGASDVVRFDDVGGGDQAVRHLLRQGFRSVGYIGIHLDRNSSETEPFSWSHRREIGWQQALESSQIDTAEMSFLPRIRRGTYRDRIQSAVRHAYKSWRQREVPAFVCANDAVAMSLVALLRKNNVPSNEWPALVGFDDIPAAQSYVMTSLRLHWEELGVAAADALWRRKTAGDSPMRVVSEVPMTLIPRMSSEDQWALNLGDLSAFDVGKGLENVTDRLDPGLAESRG